MRDFSSYHSAIALNTATLGHNLDGYGAGWSPEETIDACAERGLAGIVFWVRELEGRAAEVGRRTRAAGMRVTGLCRPPYLVGPQAPVDRSEARKGLLDTIDTAAELGAEVLTIVVGGVVPGTRSVECSLKAVQEIVADSADQAREAGVRLALEPLHPVYAADRSCLVSMRDAVEMCLEIDHSHVGVAVDVYHVWWDLTIEEQLTRLTADRILGFHMCDWLVNTSDVLLDRGMMGDGVADVRNLRRIVEAAGYDGPCEVEIFSASDWWQRDPNHVLDTMIDRARTVC